MPERLGDLSVRHLSAGTLALDGGAMFGVVPKTMWSRVYPADDRNRILLGMCLLLVEGPGGRVLVDTGATAFSEGRMAEIYDVKSRDPLAGTGLSPEDIDHVVLTHLHFDHAGGATVRTGGTWAPRYPRAAYWVDRTEWETANGPGERERASYLPESFVPLEEAGVLRLVDGREDEVVPGVTMVAAPGHTRGHRVVRVAGGDEEGWFLADLVPTTRHLPLPWIMAYDLEPLVTLESRKALYPRFVDRPVRLWFEHDPEPTSGYAVSSGSRIAFSASP